MNVLLSPSLILEYVPLEYINVITSANGFDGVKPKSESANQFRLTMRDFETITKSLSFHLLVAQLDIDQFVECFPDRMAFTSQDEGTIITFKLVEHSDGHLKLN